MKLDSYFLPISPIVIFLLKVINNNYCTGRHSKPMLVSEYHNSWSIASTIGQLHTNTEEQTL